MAVVRDSSFWVLAVLAGLVLLALGALHMSRRSSPGASRLLVPAERQPREADGITVRLRGEPPFVLRRAESGPRLSPSGLGADPASFEALRAAFAGATVLRRIAGTSASETRGRYGLAEPRAVLSWPGGPELRIGDPTADGGAYVQLGEEREVRVADAGAIEPLLVPAERYRSTALFLRPILGASRIELPRLGLLRGGDGWQLTDGRDRGQRADASAVRALLSRLDGLRAARFVAPLSSYRERPIELPRTEPPLRVRVDGRELLRGGWACPSGGPGVWLHREDGEDLCMDGANEQLSASPDALLPARLARLDAGALRRVVREHGPACAAVDVRAQTPREELVREGGWRLATPAVPLDRSATSALIDALGSLRVERWPTADEASSLSPRLDAPALRLRTEGQGGSQLIEIGCPTEEGCAARADGTGRLAILGRETCSALFAPLPARSLLALDEARLVEVCVTRGKSSGERCLPRADALPVRDALRALTGAQSVEHGAVEGSPLVVVRVRHAPPPAGVPAEDAAGEIAPLAQEIRLYTQAAERGLSAVRVGRALTYRLSAESARALAPLIGGP